MCKHSFFRPLPSAIFRPLSVPVVQNPCLGLLLLPSRGSALPNFHFSCLSSLIKANAAKIKKQRPKHPVPYATAIHESTNPPLHRCFKSVTCPLILCSAPQIVSSSSSSSSSNFPAFDYIDQDDLVAASAELCLCASVFDLLLSRFSLFCALSG